MKVDQIRNIIKDYLEYYNYYTPVDREDPSDYDFTLTDLTTDGSWHDLDLSSIVPQNARFVMLSVRVVDDAAGSYIMFKNSGNVNNNSVYPIFTQIANVANSGNFIVPCGTNRIIKYQATNTTFTSINITVQGWFI